MKLKNSDRITGWENAAIDMINRVMDDPCAENMSRVEDVMLAAKLNDRERDVIRMRMQNTTLDRIAQTLFYHRRNIEVMQRSAISKMGKAVEREMLGRGCAV